MTLPDTNVWLALALCRRNLDERRLRVRLVCDGEDRHGQRAQTNDAVHQTRIAFIG
jgi:hypothetical protein